MNTFSIFFTGPNLIEQKPASTEVDCLRLNEINLNCCELSFVKKRYLINLAESKIEKFLD